MNVSLLKLDNLNITGNFTFKLSVEDSNHEFNSTTANITVNNLLITRILRQSEHSENLNAQTI
ncbi:dyslexia-associated protein KIAA0319-like protein [Diaphorina citri]|uniref:Dyslexia-associated protein KIAA0319-like protein n=1 Tax=Diaphorina citri TaxID=121845 RepID=A0A3Q0JLH5_DIACI|nr:dyslexia-associated protein KIAA0319-like protein [Diaphorina citri]